MDDSLDGRPDGEVTEGRHLEGGSLRRSFAAEALLCRAELGRGRKVPAFCFLG